MSNGTNQSYQQDPQFLLKRIDPTTTNESIKHMLMGEIWSNSSWVTYSKPIVRDKLLLNEITSMVLKLVNSELRLATLTRDEIKEMTLEFGLGLNDLIFLNGEDEIEEPIDSIKENKNWKKLSKVDMKFFRQLVMMLTHYVHGNLTRAIDGNESTLINQVIKVVEQFQLTSKEKNGFSFGLGGKK